MADAFPADYRREFEVGSRVALLVLAVLVCGVATVGLVSATASNTVVVAGQVAALGCGMASVAMAGVLLAETFGRVELSVSPLPAVVGAIGTTGALVVGTVSTAQPMLVIVLVLPAVVAVAGAAMLVGIGLRA